MRLRKKHFERHKIEFIQEKSGDGHKPVLSVTKNIDFFSTIKNKICDICTQDYLQVDGSNEITHLRMHEDNSNQFPY